MNDTNLPKRYKKNKKLDIEQEERFRQLYNEEEIHDEVRGISKWKFLGVPDLNIRLSQYGQQSYRSYKHNIIQTLQDFQNETGFTLLQKIDLKKEKIDLDEPIAMFGKKIIYCNGLQFTETKPK